MSKLSFRARALDASKPMPIYMAEELPDLPEYSAINRAVPQMPSGMEKEEECEHHLQRAIITGLIIPTPEVFEMGDAEYYDVVYPSNYKMPRQLIHMQPFLMEQDVPEYDMDSEDEAWVNEQSKKMELTPLKFEEMMDRLEKGSGQKVVTVQEAKTLLKEDDDLTIAVYDYWLNKRLKSQPFPLIPQVKTETRVGTGSTTNNPYLAFRRRTEKMQTRKNRKNDETSYEKMLKLRRDLSRAITLLELVKRREKYKREHLHLAVEIYEKRYQAQDFSGQLMAELAALKPNRPAFAQIFNQYNNNWAHKLPAPKEEVGVRREKRQYKKRKHRAGAGASSSAAGRGSSLLEAAAAASSEEEGTALSGGSPSEIEEDVETEGAFAFRRKKACNYHAPLPNGLGNWPWCSAEEGGSADPRYRYCLASVARPSKKCIGLARRRLGRGGRVILDRASTSLDDYWSSLDFTVLESTPRAAAEVPSTSAAMPTYAAVPSSSSMPSVETAARLPSPTDAQLLSEITSNWLHFRAPSPTGSDDFAHCSMPYAELELDEEGIVAPEAPKWTESSLLEDTPPSWVLDNSFFSQPNSCFTVTDLSACTPPVLVPEPATVVAPTPSTSCAPVIAPEPIQRLALKDRINQLHNNSNSGAAHNGPNTPDGVRRGAASTISVQNSGYRTTTVKSSSASATPAWANQTLTPTRLTRPVQLSSAMDTELTTGSGGVKKESPHDDPTSVDNVLRHFMEVT